jgi:hypothetical protein
LIGELRPSRRLVSCRWTEGPCGMEAQVYPGKRFYRLKPGLFFHGLSGRRGGRPGCASLFHRRACSASVSGAIPGHPSFFVIFAISVCNNQIVNPGHNVRRMAIPSPSHDLQKGTTYGPSGMTAIAGSALAVTLSSTAERTESMELTPVRACWAGLKPVL